jgi:integrase
VVALNDEAMDALQDAYKARQSEYVIERGAKRVGNIKKAFQAASARSGIKVTPYTLRHTGAVWAAEAGASMDELAQFMGHDDSATTSTHYARYSPGHLDGRRDEGSEGEQTNAGVRFVTSAPVLFACAMADFR